MSLIWRALARRGRRGDRLRGLVHDPGRTHDDFWFLADCFDIFGVCAAVRLGRGERHLIASASPATGNDRWHQLKAVGNDLVTLIDAYEAKPQLD